MGLQRYWQILRRQKRPWRFVAGQVLMRLGLSRWVVLRQRDFRLRFYPSAISQAIWLKEYGVSSPGPPEEVFRAYLKPRDTVIDVGANIGYYTLLASVRVGPSGRVHAVEAHPRIFRYLEGNMALNRAANIQALNVALGESTGEVAFSDTKSDDQNYVVPAGAALRVPLMRLDDLETGAEAVALVKVDVEGYELFVLRGARRLLSRTACVLYESWDVHFSKYGYTAADVVGYLSDCGFQVVKPQGDALRPVLPGHRSPECEDLLAVRDVEAFLERTRWRIEKGAS